MTKNIKMLMLTVLIGGLLVSVVLTFIALGVMHPVPWILIGVLLIIPFLLKQQDKQHFVVWKEEYSVGIESLDNDHKKLLTLINQLQTTVHYHTGKQFEKETLDEVVAYTKYHFNREEKLMEEASYADFESHKKGHREMIAKVEGFLSNYEHQGHEALEEIALFLKNWLVQHINGTDKRYSAALLAKGIS